MTSNAADLRAVLGDLVTAGHRLTRLAAHEVGGSSSPAIWRTLSVLVTWPGGMRLGALAEHSRVSQPTTTKIVRSLVGQGWIAQVTDPSDARATLLEITPDGRAALDDWRDRLATALLPRFADLPADDVAVLARAVEVVMSRIDAEPGPARA
ncbi:MarR family transcriptional regulator [Clavibacter lycopersici]|uniref:MarR family transcriptional regulator n=1 Tax=Clavibacter lycopersici TaxID=2301718 RepID=A0A399TET0_9MICO|nr:MarR family transcriptional regulator [Clavibacter lycopersici]RIJ53225.1 MarR family transcriptional regulator [Clavibacter lycopersici]RIJ59381.1 MarR family transcriptional regulator [Clavibacter lycopersici]